MKTLFSVAILFGIGAVASFAFLFILNIAGLPGGLIGGKVQRGFSWRWLLGFLVATIGQSYVSLAYAAFIVNWASLAVSKQGLSPTIIWMTAFFAVAVPICRTYLGAAKEAKQDGYFHLQHAQLDALGWTTLLTIVGFFVFAFVPSLMHVMYGWVPYIGVSQSQG
jgi:hypothetical protein